MGIPGQGESVSKGFFHPCIKVYHAYMVDNRCPRRDPGDDYTCEYAKELPVDDWCILFCDYLFPSPFWVKIDGQMWENPSEAVIGLACIANSLKAGLSLRG